ALPRDPEAATQAFLNRVPAEMRERGEAVANTRYWVLGARIAVGAFSIAFFPLLFVIALPVDVYAGYVRSRHFGFSDRPFLDWLLDDVIGWATITVFY